MYYIYCILYISKQSEIGDRLAGRDFQYLRRLLLTCEYWVSYFGEGPRGSKRAVGWDEIYKENWILLPVSISLTCDIHFKPRLLKCSIFMFTKAQPCWINVIPQKWHLKHDIILSPRNQRNISVSQIHFGWNYGGRKVVELCWICSFFMKILENILGNKKLSGTE